MLYRLSYSHRRLMLVDSSNWIIAIAAGVRSLALPSAHAHVLESHGAQARRVEQILGVDDDWLFHQMPDPREIERPELRPSRGDDQGIHSFGNSVG